MDMLKRFPANPVPLAREAALAFHLGAGTAEPAGKVKKKSYTFELGIATIRHAPGSPFGIILGLKRLIVKVFVIKLLYRAGVPLQTS
jgi:hypothetical protein